MKNNIVKLVIFLLFISFGSAYADTIPDDLYGKWIGLSEEKDGKNCKTLTIDGKTKCYSIHQGASVAYTDIEPNYVWINKKENFLIYRISSADFPEYQKPILYMNVEGHHLFRINGTTTIDEEYASFYAVEKLSNDYIYFKKAYYNPDELYIVEESSELYIKEETADKLKIPVITYENVFY